MNTNTVRLTRKEKIIFWIVTLLGFQQFPILANGGSSLKTYEILGFILTGSMIVNLFSKKLKLDKNYLLPFLFFVLLPVLSFLYSSVFFDYPSEYYEYWSGSGASETLRGNYYLYPLLLMSYMIMNYCIFVSVYNTNALYVHWNKLIKYIVIAGTFISLYSLCALYVVDWVPMLPKLFQNKFTKDGIRSTGLSQEPGMYVLYQIWITLFAWNSKKVFLKRYWRVIFFINFLSLALTLSTAMWGFVVVLMCSIFIFKSSASAKGKAVFLIILGMLVAYVLIKIFHFETTFESLFINKVETFVLKKNAHKALESGGTRRMYSDMGFKILQDNPLFGVGYGRSQFYMYKYKWQVGVSVFTESMLYATVPFNMFAIVGAEMGTVGLFIMIILYLSVLNQFWKNRNKSGVHKMFLIGGISELFTFFSLYTPHAVYMWAYLALGLGYIRYYNKYIDPSKIMATNVDRMEKSFSI